ncbi:MAG TPA: restriction endonuclease [Thermoanaerobaculia bacterium]|nr:restriction endonuclease [Thermoanaerobaculia bacterium]
MIQEILASRIRAEREASEGILSRQKIRGASGQSHEIDLSFELQVAGVKVLFLVECKCYSRPVGVDEIAEFAYKLRDIGGNKGIFITTSRFESGALKIAKRERIALVIARPREETWEHVIHVFPEYARRTQHESLKPPIVFFVPGWSGAPHSSALTAAESFLHKARGVDKET